MTSDEMRLQKEILEELKTIRRLLTDYKPYIKEVDEIQKQLKEIQRTLNNRR